MRRKRDRASPATGEDEEKDGCLRPTGGASPARVMLDCRSAPGCALWLRRPLAGRKAVGQLAYLDAGPSAWRLAHSRVAGQVVQDGIADGGRPVAAPDRRRGGGRRATPTRQALASMRQRVRTVQLWRRSPAGRLAGQQPRPTDPATSPPPTMLNNAVNLTYDYRPTAPCPPPPSPTTRQPWVSDPQRVQQRPSGPLHHNAQRRDPRRPVLDLPTIRRLVTVTATGGQHRRERPGRVALGDLQRMSRCRFVSDVGTL